MKNKKVAYVALVCMGIILSGCGRVTDQNEKKNEQQAEIAKRYIYLIVPDGMQKKGMAYDVVDTIGCNDMLVRIEDDTLTSPAQALEKMINYSDDQNGYYNSLAASDIHVAHVMTDEDGATNVFFTGQLRMGGMCDVPRIQAQIEYAVQQYDENAFVRVFVNDVPLEDILSEK